MDKQTLIFTALPNGHDKNGSRARLSVFISHRLWSSQADAPATTLQAFPDLLDWPATLAALDWEARVDDGQGSVQQLALELDPEFEGIDNGLWQRLFKPDTRVNPHRFDDYRQVQLHMLDLATLHDAMRDLYGRVGGSRQFGSGGRLPLLAELAQDKGVIAPGYFFRQPESPRPLPAEEADAPPYPGAAPEPPPEVPLPPAPQADDPPGLEENPGCLGGLIALLQCVLRRITGTGEAWKPGGAAPTLPDPPLVMPIEPAPAAALEPAPAPEPEPPAPTPPVLDAVHLAQRAAFDDLAGSLAPQDAGKPLPAQADLAEEWDLHQALAAFGDYPALMRWLGLVVDLLLPEGVALPARGRVQVQASGHAWQLGSASTVVASPHTHFLAEPAALFTAAPRAEKPLIRRGFLAIDDPDEYRIVQNEVVGDAMKLREASARIAASGDKAGGARSAATPEATGLPALRGGGFSLLRIDSLGEIRARIRRSIMLERALATRGGTPSPDETPDSSDELHAEDLVRGYRVDVRSTASGRWRSLCQRDGEYRFLDADAPTERKLTDEGFIQFAGQRTNEELLFPQTMFTWDGWSLAAPTPGLSVMEGDGPPESVGNDAVTPFRIETTFKPVDFSLPRLRYGTSYRLRMRVADLAGNSIVEPEDDGFDDDGPSVTAEEEARRFDPVPPPTLLHRAPPVAGESLERLVVRCYASPARNGDGAPLVSARHVLPPRGSQALAERESRLDGLSPDDAYDWSIRESADLEYGATLLPPDAARPADGDPDASPSEVFVNAAAGITAQYLPDPRAAGLHLQLVDGDAALALPIDVPYTGTWPDLRSIRIELHAGPLADASVVPGSVDVVRVTLPPGHRARLRFNSLLAPGAVDSMALEAWVRRAQADGWQEALQHMAESEHHMLTPWRDIELVHAAQQPQSDPKVVLSGLEPGIDGHPIARREAHSRKLVLSGEDTPSPPWLQARTDPHSTGSVHLRADWKDIVDDPAKDAEERVEQSDVTAECPVQPGNDEMPMVEYDGRQASLNLLDTRHHLLGLTPVATSRYREYFDPADQQAPDTIRSGPVAFLHAPNCGTPPPPELLYAVPTFHWQVTPATAGDPVIVHVRQGGGLRLYLQRPWFETGEDEQLGVLYLPGDRFPPGTDKKARQFTVWGSDPTQVTAGPDARAGEASFLDADHHRHGLPLPDGNVSVAAYVTHPNPDRKLRYVDLCIDPGGDAWWPFVRLALARYQPYSIPGCHLSEPVLADYIQLPPPRRSQVRRAADGSLAFEVTGPTVMNGLYRKQGMEDPIQLEAVIERYLGSDDGDEPLLWEPVSAVLPLQRQHADGASLGQWTGAMAMPLGAARLRLVLREYLYLRGDDSTDTRPRALAQMRRRLLYADGIELRF